MSLLNKKKKEIEQASDRYSSLYETTAAKASSIIKELHDNAAGREVTLVDNLIVMTGVNGGTGVSTIVSNVAYKLATEHDLKVIVVDTEIQKPIQHIFLGIPQEQVEKPDLVSVILGNSSLAEAINNEHEYSLLYANNRTISDDIKCDTVESGEAFIDMLNILKKNFDVVIVDTQLDLKSNLRNRLIYRCDALYIVWDEGVQSIMNFDKARRNMKYCGIDAYTKTRIILNKRTNIRYSMTPIERFNAELISIIPFEPAVIESSLHANIFCKKAASNAKNALEFEKAINELADEISRIGGNFEETDTEEGK